MFDEPDRQSELYREKVKDIEEDARKIGLYLNGVSVQPDPQSTGDVMILTFNIGNVAVSDRIQDPEKDKLNDAIRTIEGGVVQDDFKKMREELLDDMKATEDDTD